MNEMNTSVSELSIAAEQDERELAGLLERVFQRGLYDKVTADLRTEIAPLVDRVSAGSRESKDGFAVLRDKLEQAKTALIARVDRASEEQREHVDQCLESLSATVAEALPRVLEALVLVQSEIASDTKMLRAQIHQKLSEAQRDANDGLARVVQAQGALHADFACGVEDLIKRFQTNTLLLVERHEAARVASQGQEDRLIRRLNVAIGLALMGFITAAGVVALQLTS